MVAHRKTLFALAAFAGVLAGTGFSRSEPPDHGTVVGNDSKPSMNSAALAAADIERRLIAAYERVRPALVWIEGTDGKNNTFDAGIIVTSNGHVLMSDVPSTYSLKFRLSGGEPVPGEVLGWSHEWGIAVAKLQGNEEWPHVELSTSDNIRAGQRVATLSFSLNERAFASQPLLDLASVSLCAPGKWFLTSPDGTDYWKVGRVAIDMDGRLVGLRTLSFPTHGVVFTQTSLIQSLWIELVKGTNLDALRLGHELAANEQPRKSDRPISEAIKRKASNATVHVRPAPGEKGYSGVVIRSNGVIATCAHHFMLPGTSVTVSFPDGRDLKGEVLGISFPSDIGLVKITEAGPFEHVETGSSAHLSPQDKCFALGYGLADDKAREPVFRELVIAEPPDGRWTFELPSSGEKWGGGDCGGGVFNQDGHLVAILLPGSGIPHSHKRVEALNKKWDELLTPLDVVELVPSTELDKELERLCQRASGSIVEIMSGKNCVELGTIVSKDGLVVTKASMLPRRISCRLSDGRVMVVKRIRSVRSHDVAVLKIEGDEFPQFAWHEGAELPVGAVVAVPGASAVAGVISHPRVSIPGERGYLWAEFKDTSGGPQAEKISRMSQGTIFAKLRPSPLVKGDVVNSIDGHPTPNRDDLLALFRQPTALDALAGDVVHIVASRDGNPIEYDAALWPPTWPRMAGQSTRCSGFSDVYSVAVSPEWTHCGGPVLDLSGRTIGVAIAGRQKGWAIVLPASQVKAVLQE